MRSLARLAEPATFVGILMLLSLLYTFYAVRRGRVRSLGWCWLGVLCVYLGVATPAGGNALLRPLESAARDAATLCEATRPGPGLAVVMAGGTDSGAATEADYQVLSEGSLRRTIAAAQWARADGSRLVLVTGGRGDVPEALLMARLLIDLGVDKQNVIVDSESKNTQQSGRNVAERLRQLSIGRVLVITSADHMPRTVAALQSRRVATCALPVDFRYVAPILPGHLVPTLSALAKSTRALHEYIGLLMRAQE